MSDDLVVTLAELCAHCEVSVDTIIALVEEGVIEPLSPDGRVRWVFTAASLRRASTAVRLQRDLQLNLSGVALALELLDRIEKLESQLRAR